MEYSLKLKNEVKQIYYNVMNLLEDRGYGEDVLGKNISTDTIDFKIHNFLESSEGDSTFLDLFIPGDISTYVKFINGENIDKVVKAGTINKFKKIVRDVMNVADMSTNDNIIFVLVDTIITTEGRDGLNDIESAHPYLRIFAHKELLINIARHMLVPEHRLYKKSKFELFKKLMIHNYDQLPYILHTDPMARYHNFRHNDIVEVRRPTKTSGYHTVYRRCMDEKSKINSDRTSNRPRNSNKPLKIAQMSTKENSTITLTFSECVENHAKNQQIGEKGIKGSGFTIDELLSVKKTIEDLNDSSYSAEVYDLVGLSKLNENAKSGMVVEPASLIVIRNGVKFLLDNHGEGVVDNLFAEQAELNHDKKAKMYGKVCNKHARHNLCFADFSQEPNYELGKGRIIKFGDSSISLTNEIRTQLPRLLPGGKMENLLAEGNYYYDKSICGIGFHGDEERRKVLGVRLGASMSLKYQWFHKSEPVPETKSVEIILNHGDIYMMSEKASGTDFKKSSKYTLRHSAGCPKFTTYIDKKKKEEKAV